MVKARFQVCHPDVWEIPASANIALQAIVEAYWNMKMAYGMWEGTEQPISEEQASELVRTHPRQLQLEYWLELARGKRVLITAEEFQRLKADEPGGEKVAGIRSSGDVYHKFYNPEYASFALASRQEITELHLEDEVGNPRKNDDDPDPQATLVFTVRDVMCLGHLVEGFHFDSAMFDFTAYCASMQ
jgi:MoaA/NifB/PqqE/SkfB family radical SAM enzyme